MLGVEEEQPRLGRCIRRRTHLGMPSENAPGMIARSPQAKERRAADVSALRDTADYGWLSDRVAWRVATVRFFTT